MGAFCLLCGVITGLLGCSEEKIPFTEVRRPDEKLTAREVQAVLEVMAALPNRKLPDVPSPWIAPPVWNNNRPIKALVQFERQEIEAVFSPSRLAKKLPNTRRFEEALQKVQLTREQFAGILLSLGVALARADLPEDFDLDKITRAGESVLERLEQDDRVFTSLSDDGAYAVQQDAAWLPFVDRAVRLSQVPVENLALAKRNGEKLKAAIPETLWTNPLPPLLHLLNESGLPFEELSETGSDTQFFWKPGDTHVSIKSSGA